jgi:hypothetical protein
MARKGSLSFVEQHIEKVALGAAGLLTVVVAVMYLGMEPNKVKYSGRELGPGALDDAILQDARRLESRIESRQPEQKEVLPYARMLRESWEKGLFEPDVEQAEAGPPIALRELRAPAAFGQPLPNLGTKPPAEDVALVKPQPPNAVAARTGISLAYVEPPVVPNLTDNKAPLERDAATELSWVTVGGYFSEERQRDEMIEHGYAGHLAKVYVVGIDVQRQELQADGEFSDWEPVPQSKTTPRVDLHGPVFDDKTGELANQAELDTQFLLVRSLQAQFKEPLFYEVKSGDPWRLPPLPGYEDIDKQEEEQPGEELPRIGPSGPPAGAPGGPRTRMPPGGPSMPPGVTGRSSGPPSGGRGVSPRGGMMPPGISGPRGGGMRPTGPSTPREDPKAQIRQQIRDAREALEKKDWGTAEQAARSVMNDQNATRGQQRQAQRIVEEAETGRKKEQELQEKLSAGPRVRLVDQRVPDQVYPNPEKEGEVAVWYHDDSVEPGRTYRYRMRVDLLNTYLGRREALKDPAQAETVALKGEWSLPSAPITVAPKRHFFVAGPKFGEPAARVDVFTWHKGHWLRETFDVEVGDVIGEVVKVKTGELLPTGSVKREDVDFCTGAVVLDLRSDQSVLARRSAGKEGEFAYSERDSLVLVYLNPADGRVQERVADFDRADPLYKRLKDEYDRLKSWF